MYIVYIHLYSEHYYLIFWNNKKVGSLLWNRKADNQEDEFRWVYPPLNHWLKDSNPVFTRLFKKPLSCHCQWFPMIYRQPLYLSILGHFLHSCSFENDMTDTNMHLEETSYLLPLSIMYSIAPCCYFSKVFLSFVIKIYLPQAKVKREWIKKKKKKTYADEGLRWISLKLRFKI